MAVEYERLTPREHLLKRPDTQLGAISHQTLKLPAIDTSDDTFTTCFHTIVTSPALYKLLDEVKFDL